MADLSHRALSGLEARHLAEGRRRRGRPHAARGFQRFARSPGDGRLLNRLASSGWEPTGECEPTFSTSTHGLHGYTLAGRQPVVVDDLKTDSRLSDSIPDCLVDVVSAMSVIVHGRTGPSGVLATYSRTRRVFTNDYILFLQTMSAVLATADDRHGSRRGAAVVGEEVCQRFPLVPRLDDCQHAGRRSLYRYQREFSAYHGIQRRGG